jgi:hypothetical protein
MPNKKVVFLFLVFSPFLIACQSIKKVTVFSVSGNITQTFAYCGGMAPSPEIMEEMNRPQVYSKKVLFVRRGNTNTLKKEIVLKFISDSLGNFSFKLRPGIYSVIEAEQVKRLNPSALNTGQLTQIDTACLKEWWKKPLQILEIKDKNITNLNFNFYHKCFISGDLPCIDYVGPLPP